MDAETEQPYDESVPSTADPAPPPEQALQASQRGVRMAAALAALPMRQREAIVLQYYQELSNDEAAMLTGISVAALESLLSRARRNLRDLLVRDGEEKP